MPPCLHITRINVTRNKSNGVEVHGTQCTNCGTFTLTPRDDSVQRIPYDPGIAARYTNRQKAAAATARANARLEKRRWLNDEYKRYLRSPEWDERRKRCISRNGGVCTGCNQRPATVAHHLTYEHWGEEFDFELTGLCRLCHDRYHESRKRRKDRKATRTRSRPTRRADPPMDPGDASELVEDFLRRIGG